ncbi:hypothetical protein D3C76_1258800 [compost metagenome]
MTNVAEQDRVRVGYQFTVARHHVRTGNRIDLAIDHPQRHVAALHRPDPTLALDSPLGDVGNQFVHDPWAMVAFDQAPEIIHLALAGTGLRAEDLAETLHQAIATERTADHPPQRAEQEFLHQHRAMGFGE